MRYATTGQVPTAIGNRHPSIAPFEPFETADRPIIIAAGNDVLFQRLCNALGKSELAKDSRFARNRDRLQNIDILKDVLDETLRQASADHWLDVLQQAGVPCSPIHTVADAVEHPQVQARNMIVRAGELRMAGNPIKFSGFEDQPTRQPAPQLDADGQRIRDELRGG
jgi:CoA:oxalate CoA-transferase